MLTCPFARLFASLPYEPTNILKNIRLPHARVND
jgi:hypothetical protein